MQYTCIICGAEIEDDHYRRYCSRECAGKGRTIYNEAHRTGRKCGAAGKVASSRTAYHDFMRLATQYTGPERAFLLECAEHARRAR